MPAEEENRRSATASGTMSLSAIWNTWIYFIGWREYGLHRALDRKLFAISDVQLVECARSIATPNPPWNALSPP